eukprot:310811-Prymnesium_polylepis.1
MLNIRPARRNTSARSHDRQNRNGKPASAVAAPSADRRAGGLRANGFDALRTRGTALGGRSAGSLSTVCRHGKCVMLDTRPARRNTSARSTK